ncbi:zinc finger protein 1 homolog isoform X5 [Osmia bicornis bicornis]|uniref:zinc finger protein 1 homolog isoform X5 n=1 Tax=Osmia bicornis bicornis TaxID=1437191 RepID=UPI001EAEBE48|nr:zinc finger protein 1 homolog isoform X5 [Osmia bicornis bicornis]
MSSLDYLDLCRLCLVKDRVSVPIFEGEGDVRQIFLKIAACLPVKVTREDKLPKKICDDCVYKVELFYQFWNTTANAEKQLLQWLGEVNIEDKQGYVTNVLNPNVMKQEQRPENRLDGNVMQQVGEHQNNMGMGMMDNMGLGIPMMISNANQQQQITSVPMDTSGNSVQPVQAVPGPSSQTTHNQISQNQSSSTQQEDEEESSEDEENSDDECDGDEGLPVKEESEEDPNNRTIEPTTFVNVSLACDEAGPSGLQQKISDIPEMPMPQTADGDPKTGTLNGNGRFLYGKESIAMQPWQVVDVEGSLYYAFLPANQGDNLSEFSKSTEKLSEENRNNTDDDEKDFIVPIEEKTSQADERCTVKVKEEDFEEDIDEKPEEVYACKECNISFPVIQMLKRHQSAVHEQAQRYKCKVCLKVCRSLVAFKMHVALEHKEEEEQNPKDNDSLTYTCNFCDYESTNKSTLTSHISRKHAGKAIDKRRGSYGSSTEPKEYSCNECEFKCQNRRKLKEHLERKHASEYKYDCEYCGKKFKVKGDMRLHVRFKHKEGPIVCDVCGKTCSNSNSLYVHQKWAHFKPKYECAICKRRMVTQENLDQHILLQHERRESFVCEECGKSFSENHRLKQHMMTHTGDRPYDCHICGKAFARRTAYRQHLLIHTGKRPYICDICGKTFTQKPGLICHRKSHPGVHPPLPVVHIDHILSDFMKKD